MRDEVERLTVKLEEITARMQMTLGAFQAYRVLDVEMPEEHRLNASENLDESFGELAVCFSDAIQALEVDEDES